MIAIYVKLPGPGDSGSQIQIETENNGDVMNNTIEVELFEYFDDKDKIKNFSPTLLQ